MATLDYLIIVAYLVALVVIGFTRRAKRNESAAGYILGGRTLTLPAFVATLVSTWYGGILGVGEYSFRFGVSNWLVFGLPYYLAALLFALFLAKKARRAKVLTIPDRLESAYGRPTAVTGSIILYLTTIPSAYLLMLAVLAKFLFGWPLWLGASLGVLFSLFYVHLGGFRSVVRTDLLQFSLMFVGFIVLLVMLVEKYGGYAFIAESVPATHLTWHGGNSGWYIATWYFIALATLTEPAFYQRCYAARTETAARNGILISILFWAVFDFLTTSCGLYARALLPDLTEPISSYPALASMILPTGLLGLFALSLIATIMSTIDSYSFLAASTFGRDIIWRIGCISERKIMSYTRLGLLISAILALILALYFESVIDIWHDFGSVATPALLVPLFFAFNGKRRMSSILSLICIIASGGISLVWLFSEHWTAGGGYWLGIAPIFPGLAVSILFHIFGSRRQKEIV